MSSVREITQAIRDLDRTDLAALRDWFAEFDSGVWDLQIERDAVAGKLDLLASEALADLQNSRCQNL